MCDGWSFSSARLSDALTRSLPTLITVFPSPLCLQSNSKNPYPSSTIEIDFLIIRRHDISYRPFIHHSIVDPPPPHVIIHRLRIFSTFRWTISSLTFCSLSLSLLSLSRNCTTPIPASHSYRVTTITSSSNISSALRGRRLSPPSCSL